MSDEEFLDETLVHLDMVYNLARRLTSGLQDAEDLVSETYLRALKGWRRAPPRQTAPWLATICLNTGRSEHRKRAARPQEVLEADPGYGIAARDDTATEVLGVLERGAIQRALDRLSDEQREAITLMDLCGFTAGQAAEILSTPRNTVLSRVHRGHKRLASMLEELIVPDSFDRASGALSFGEG